MVQTVETTLAQTVARETSKGPIWDLVDVNGQKFSTWTEATYHLALGLVGRPVSITYDSQMTTGRNGQTYENKTVQQILPSNGAQAPAVPAAVPNPIQPLPQPVHHVSVAPVVSQAPSEDVRAHAIAKAVALKAAVDYAQHITPPLDHQQVLALADAWLPWLEA